MSEIKYLDQLKHTPNTAPVRPSGQNSQVPYKTAPIPNDSVEISSKTNKCDTSCLLRVAGMLALTAAAVGGITHGGIKLYENNFKKLASGVKKGEINDALFNFIHRIDPKGKIFRNKQDIIKINENLTDENFLILKRLSKMKNPRMRMYTRDGVEYMNRFSAEEMTQLLKSTNEHNIKYLTELAEINVDKYGNSNRNFLGTKEIVKVLEKINGENEEIASQLIRKANTDSIPELVKCLEGVNKDNLDIYKLVMSTRMNAGTTELSYEEISSLAKTIQERKNPKIMEFFLNQKHKDGTGTYRHKIEDLPEYVTDLKDENIEIYKKLYEMKVLEKTSDKNMQYILKNTNSENIDIIESLLTKEHSIGTSNYTVFSSYEAIGNILALTNKKNKPIVSKMIELCDSSLMMSYTNYSDERKVEEFIVLALKELNSNPKKMAELKEMVAKGVTKDGKPLQFKDMVKVVDIPIKKRVAKAASEIV